MILINRNMPLLFKRENENILWNFVFQEHDRTRSETQNIINLEFLIFKEHDLTAQVKKKTFWKCRIFNFPGTSEKQNILHSVCVKFLFFKNTTSLQVKKKTFYILKM